MARTMQVILVDDLDGGSAQESVLFGLDGVSYEIDLSKANAAKLRKALAPYVAKGRRTGGRRTGAGASGAKRVKGRPSKSGRDVPAIRAWAKSAGLLNTERGRIPAEVVAAYDRAHQAKAAS